MILKLISILWTMVAFLQHGHAQVDYNPKSNTLACSKTGGRYCVSGSLNGPIMLSCLSKTLVEVRSYNIELSRILPQGYEDGAVCYETFNTGDAVCAFNGTGYTLTGTRMSIPETSVCEQHIPLLHNGRESAGDAVRPDRTVPSGTIWNMNTATTTTTKRQDPVCPNGILSPIDTALYTKTMDVSATATAPTHTVKPVSLIATSSNVQSTTFHLPLDAAGKPYTIVSEIDSAEPDMTTSAVVITSTGNSTTMVYTTAVSEHEAPSSSKGIVLVEPSESATTGAVSAVTGTSAAGAAGTGAKMLRWVVVVCGLMGLV